MEILTTIGLVILVIVVIIGVIRILINPYTGFLNFILEVMLLDLLFDCLGWLFENLFDIFDNDWD